MAKFLLVIAVFIVIYLLMRNHARRQNASSKQEAATGNGPAEAGSTKSNSFAYGENMVRCNACGVHLPTSEAVTSRGEFFCSKEHLQLGSRKPTEP
ncbi:MAG: PP0621 family protein [Betaproteobacteria bacterium]